MKDIFHIAKLISKEKVGDLSVEEQKILQEWLASNENHQAAYNLAADGERIKKNHDLYSKINEEKSWTKITNEIPELKKTKVIKLRAALKWAAVILFPLLATTFLLNEVYWSADDVVVEAGKAQAVLELENGQTILLEDYQGKTIKSGKEQVATNTNNNLIYNKGVAQEEQLAYNTIKTPVQGEYSMVLSDGTRVWLNAKSELRYPVKFGKGKREVNLSGEAYFEVAKDSSKAFVVHIANGSEVKVLGTEFNVMAYEDEEEVQTTLIEGKVQFAHNDEEVILSPGKQSGLNRNTNQIEVRKVKTYQYSAWKDGKFVFSREPLSSVFRKISRWYGVDVKCDDQELLNRRISGVMNKYENVSKLIDLLEEVSPVDIEINKHELIVSRK
jgi:ferric-dicitrate binding protein FerR (iron transport regulator)